MQETNSEYVHETLGIESKATKTIIFEGYGLKNKKMLSPTEAQKIMYEEREVRDEKSGKTLLKSDGFKSAFLSYLDTVEFERGQCEELNEFGFRITLTSKIVEIKDCNDYSGSSFDSPMTVEWEDINELFDNNELNYNGTGYGKSPEQLREMIEEFDQRNFSITSTFEMEFAAKSPVKAFLSEYREELFKFNKSGKGMAVDPNGEVKNRSCSNPAFSSSLPEGAIKKLERFIEVINKNSV